MRRTSRNPWGPPAGVGKNYEKIKKLREANQAANAVKGKSLGPIGDALKEAFK